MTKFAKHLYLKHFLLCLTLLSFGPRAATPAKKVVQARQRATKAPACEAHAVDQGHPRGLHLHDEHWIDLVLAQAGQVNEQSLNAFLDIGNSLLTSIRSGKLEQINEKIDGSPSFVFGWTPQGKFFVAYKNHFAAPTQKLITDEATARAAFPRSEVLRELFAQIFSRLAPELSRVRGLRNYIFQADLLFVDEQRRTLAEDAVVIKPNTIPYRIGHGHPLFTSSSKARVGLAVHSVVLRRSRVDRLAIAPLENGNNGRALIEKMIQQLRGDSVFVIHPHRDNETLSPPTHPRFFEEAEELSQVVAREMRTLDVGFREVYSTGIESELRIFINSFVRTPTPDGLFQTIARGDDIDPIVFIEKFRSWLGTRERFDKSVRALKILTASKIREELTGVVRAYVAAIRLQNLISPSLAPIMRSKLGDGPIEGLMLSTPTNVVKWVDRLTFTVANSLQNARNNAAPVAPVAPDAPTISDENPFAELPAPFNEWRPGQAFALMKGQPWHPGHFKMLGIGQVEYGSVLVVASNKAPDLKADTGKALGAAETLKLLGQGIYKHVFGVKLRKKLFNAGIGDNPNVHAFFMNTGDMWRYLKIAKEKGLPGKIRLIVGQKEADEGRYNDQLARYPDHFEVTAIPLQENGISATAIRALIKRAASGDAEALEELNEVYSFVSEDKERESFISSMLREWKAVDRAAKRILEAKAKK